MPKLRKPPAWMRPAAEQPLVTAHIEQQILANQSRIIGTLGKEPIEVYDFLCRQFKAGAVDKNPLFQFVYRSYYRLDSGGLSDDLKSRYFELMEEARKSGAIDLTQLAKDLRRFKASRHYKRAGRAELREVEVLPFSFITKLAATVSSDYPIYDRKVGDVLGFPPPDGIRDWDMRLEQCLKFYAWLQALYDRLLSGAVIPSAIFALNAHYSVALPNMKALDFLFWQAGKLEIRAVP